MLFNLILKITWWRRYCYYPHFASNTLLCSWHLEDLWVSPWPLPWLLEHIYLQCRDFRKTELSTWATCLYKWKFKPTCFRGFFLFDLFLSAPKILTFDPSVHSPGFCYLLFLALSLAFCHSPPPFFGFRVKGIGESRFWGPTVKGGIMALFLLGL